MTPTKLDDTTLTAVGRYARTYTRHLIGLKSKAEADHALQSTAELVLAASETERDEIKVAWLDGTRLATDRREIQNAAATAYTTAWARLKKASQ